MLKERWQLLDKFLLLILQYYAVISPYESNHRVKGTKNQPYQYLLPHLGIAYENPVVKACGRKKAMISGMKH